MKKFIVSFFVICAFVLGSNKIVFALSNSSPDKGIVNMSNNMNEVWHMLGGTNAFLALVFSCGLVGLVSIGILSYIASVEDENRKTSNEVLDSNIKDPINTNTNNSENYNSFGEFFEDYFLSIMAIITVLLIIIIKI